MTWEETHSLNLLSRGLSGPGSEDVNVRLSSLIPWPNC